MIFCTYCLSRIWPFSKYQIMFGLKKVKRNVIFYALSQVSRNVNILNVQGEYIVTASVRKSWLIWVMVLLNGLSGDYVKGPWSPLTIGTFSFEGLIHDLMVNYWYHHYVLNWCRYSEFLSTSCAMINRSYTCCDHLTEWIHA